MIIINIKTLHNTVEESLLESYNTHTHTHTHTHTVYKVKEKNVFRHMTSNPGLFTIVVKGTSV